MKKDPHRKKLNQTQTTQKEKGKEQRSTSNLENKRNLTQVGSRCSRYTEKDRVSSTNGGERAEP